MIRATGYLKSMEDLAAIPLGMNARGTPIRLADVAEIRTGPTNAPRYCGTQW